MSSKSRPAGLLGCSTVGQSISPIALRDMFQSILYHLESYERTRKEEHEVVIATLN